MHDIDWIRYPATPRRSYIPAATAEPLYDDSSVLPVFDVQANSGSTHPDSSQKWDTRPKNASADLVHPCPPAWIWQLSFSTTSDSIYSYTHRRNSLPANIYIYITRDLLLTADIPYCTQNPVFEISGLLSDKWTVSQRGGFIRRSLPYITPVLRLLARGQ